MDVMRLNDSTKTIVSTWANAFCTLCNYMKHRSSLIGCDSSFIFFPVPAFVYNLPLWISEARLDLPHQENDHRPYDQSQLQSAESFLYLL